MSNSILEKFTIERSLIYILIAAVLIVFGFIFYLFFGQFSKRIEVLAPNGEEEWGIGQTYEITWESRGIEKVGIVLFKENEPKWIAKNVSAKLGRYEWKIYPGQEYRDGYWIAVFEYPWQKGNEIDYSNGSFAVTFSELISCDALSTENEWLYLPSDLSDLRRVFITQEQFTGNLEGLEGADEKCQIEAEERGFEGKWHAFLGGDSDEDLAVERLKRTPRGTEGVFIIAPPAATLIRGATCHRLLAKDFDEFLAKFSNPLIINEEKLEKGFLKDLENIWLGRVNETSKKNCIPIAAVMESLYLSLAEKYSFTVTCQNWTQGNKLVEGYPVPTGELKPSFPTCYTSTGEFTDAVALGALSSGLTGKGSDTALTLYQGKYCNAIQKLLCIEE